MDSHILDKITQMKATELVNSYHQRTTTLGCWESNVKLHHRGYVLIHLTTGGCRHRPFLHQIALIADNRHDELRATLHGRSYDVSHLCHNRKCFNPEHLVVESRTNNTRRQACNGHKILVGAGFSYHPCWHGSVEKMRKCILPVQPLQDPVPNSDEQPSTAATPAPDLHDTAIANNATDADPDTGKWDQITPTMAQELISRYRTVTTDLECWQSKLKPDVLGYYRVNLKKLGVQPFLHQLALIADNRGAELKSAVGGRGSYYSVTHLCHNNSCYNPQHLVVESKSDNYKRKACKGKAILVREGITYHPCVHDSVEGMHKCILPVQHAPDTMSNSDDEPSAEATRALDLDDTATGNDGADANKFDHITPTLAQEVINGYRVITTDLGCWESGMKGDRGGYFGTRLKIPGYARRKIFLHQLAVIASNRGAELQATYGFHRENDISHLCHNRMCFNPEHLIVESRRDNVRRRTCVGHKVILYLDFEYHPCQHGEVGKMRKCILPLLRLEAGHHVNGSV